MNLDLPNDVNDFVKGLVSQGRFDSEEAAVVEGIRLLMSREKLRGEIQQGVEQLDNGQSFDEESVFAELDAEIDGIESSSQPRGRQHNPQLSTWSAAGNAPCMVSIYQNGEPRPKN